MPCNLSSCRVGHVYGLHRQDHSRPTYWQSNHMKKCITSTVLLLFYSQALQLALTNSGYVKYLAFQMKVLIRNLLWSNVQWRIMISYLIFWASIWAAFEKNNHSSIVLLVRNLPAKAIISNIFLVFQSEGREPDRVDNVSEIDSYLSYNFCYYYTHGYSSLLSAIQGMCPIITLASKLVSVSDGDSSQQKAIS